MEIDLHLNEIFKKPIDVIELKGIEQCTLRVINLKELIRNFSFYKDLLQSIDVICIIINSTMRNIENTQKLLSKLKQKAHNADYYIIASFQDRKRETLEVRIVEELLGEKTYGFSAVQKDSQDRIIDIIKDILKISILEKEEKVAYEKDIISKESQDKDKAIYEDVEVKGNYLSIWSEIEGAKTLEQRGNHLKAAKKFSNAASQLKEISSQIFLTQKREEIDVLYSLCKAWECMELAEKYKEPKKFSEATNHFAKASERSSDRKLKLLALVNSKYCKALKIGLEFDISNETSNKVDCYPKIKTVIKKATDLYREGGFEKEAEWALATSSYFDAIWYLIRADEELNLDEKKKILDVASGYFLSAAKIFGKAGYKEKEKEVIDRLNMEQKKRELEFLKGK